DRVVEGAVTEAPAGGVKRPPGLRPYLAVDTEPPTLLEGAYRPLGVGVEVVEVRRVGGAEQVEADEDGADLGDGRPPVAPSDHTHVALPLRVGVAAGRVPRTTPP